jgi:hypothetical protein
MHILPPFNKTIEGKMPSWVYGAGDRLTNLALRQNPIVGVINLAQSNPILPNRRGSTL